MKKAFDQTVREIKREVNKKVLKVPGVEQKVLDATSNEPWGPHGTLLADIAQATRNYHEYQMIMQVIWKRINDAGKNWRHVYKGLTVLEYLVAHGSERVIDEIRERTYQISTLSDFQYIDHNGRDQGSNVRKKSQTLVNLVNDKERIEEVRQNAAVNRDRFRNTSLGGMYRHGSGGYGYEDDRYSSRDDDRNGYGREKEWGSDHYGRDGDYRGRSQSVDGYRYSPRSRSYDRDRGRGYEDDGQYSSRGSGAKADDRSQDGSVSSKGIQRKFSEPNLNAPPSYEEAVTEARTSVHSERGGEIPSAPGPVRSSPSQTEVTSGVSAPPPSASPPPQASLSPPYPAPSNKEVDSFDEFDPRGSFGVAQPATRNADVDLLGSLYDLNPLAIVPVTPESTFSESDTSAGTIYSAAPSASQPFDDPFGDGPFRAQSQNIAPTNPYSQIPHTTDSSFVPQDFSTSNHDNTDVLADILPLSGPSPTVPSQTGLPPQHFSTNGYSAQASPHEQQANFPTHAPLQNTVVPQSNFGGHNNSVSQPAFQTANHYRNYLQQQQGQVAPHMVSQPGPLGPTQQFNTSNFVSQNRHNSFESSNALALVPQPAEDRKFETKSTVWADTLSRGLVNLNISGSKTNPLADIGVDFDAINRREKRMEKLPTSNVTSTITMGKAMGSGSGIGRAGAGAIRPPIHSIGGPTMGIGGMNRPPIGMNMGGQNMGMGVNMGPNIGMNMGMAQGGGPMQQPYSGYNPMMVRGGGYVQTQPYGGGYR